MKKVFRLMLALALVLSLTATVFADTFEESLEFGLNLDLGMGDIHIEAEYDAQEDNKDEILAGTEGKVYYLILNWQQFGILDTTRNTEEAFTDARLTLTAINRGNRPMAVACGTPDGRNGVTAISGSYDKSAILLPSAAIHGFDAAGMEQVWSTTYTVDSVTGQWNGIGNIGAVTVTITGQ